LVHAGRGTATLVVKGHAVTVDATALTADAVLVQGVHPDHSASAPRSPWRRSARIQ